MKTTMRPAATGSLPTDRVAEFTAALSSYEDADTAKRGALTLATAAVDGCFGAIVAGDLVPFTIGFSRSAPPATELLALAQRGARTPVSVPGIRGACFVAAVALDDEGALVIGRETAFGDAERSLLRAMARVLSLGLRNIRTVAALQERQGLFERMSDILRSITQRADLQQTLDAIVAGAAALVEEPIAMLRLRDPEDPEWVQMVSSVGVPDQLGDRTRRSPLGQGAGGRAIEEERLVVIENYQDADRTVPAFSAYRVQTAMSAPVRDQGRVVGSLTVATLTSGRRFSASEQDALLTYAEHASLAITDARMVEDANHRAMHDTLTGLPNRALFLDRVEHALASARRRGTSIAVLFLDLDHFKVVNDSLGHPAGDELLVAVAERMREALRHSDTVARFGGDEFGILVEDVGHERDAILVAEQVAALFVQPFALEGREHFVSASIGIALSHQGVDSPDSLIRDSDAAMYRAKAHGRAGYEMFDELMRARALHRLRVEAELRRAIMQKELRVAYQPIVNLASGEVLGAEALVRWQHPERGTLLPGEFIAVAEESGLIGRLGEWVLRAACTEAARWARSRPDGPPLTVSVNLSGRQMGDSRLPAVVEEILAGSGLDPAYLVLEITESVLLEDADAPKDILQAIKNLGVRLVLDDFGTGYSSLGYLKRLPLDGLKIDRSFVDGLGTEQGDSAIVSAVLGMASGLGLAVTAEGVETDEQRAALLRLGCLRAQGHLFSEPVDAEAFRALADTIPRPWASRLPRSTR